MNEEKKINKNVFEIFWVFMIGSVFGYLYETILCLIQRGHFESRQGLVYGPLTPIYGAGLVVMVLLLAKRKHIISMFVISALAGGVVEYVFSLLQQFFFGTVSWDYHNQFNLAGRTSLFHCVIWGILGVGFIKLILPSLLGIIRKLFTRRGCIFTLFLMVFMAVNIVISWGAATRQDERQHNISPNSVFDHFFDRRFPDSRMDQIFANKKVVEDNR